MLHFFPSHSRGEDSAGELWIPQASGSGSDR